jgi:hypothetical protein
MNIGNRTCGVFLIFCVSWFVFVFWSKIFFQIGAYVRTINGFLSNINNYVLATTLRQMYIQAKSMRKIVL